MAVSVVLASAIGIFTRVLNFLVFIRCIISWFPVSNTNVLIQLIYALTEPILGPVRNIIQKSPLGGPGMMIDFSPIIALFFVEFAGYILQTLVMSIPF
jgi:YggT family protein